MAKLDVPSIRGLYDAFISDYEERTGQTTPLLQSAFIRMLAWPHAGLTVLCYRFGQWIYFQMFLETCSFGSLRVYGDRVGIKYKTGSACVASCTVSGIAGTVTDIPSGTVFVDSAANTYQTGVSTPVIGGVAICVVTSTKTGAAYNVNIGDVLTMAKPLSGAPATGYVTSMSVEGEDPETKGEYRARVRSRYRSQPQGGAPADYKIWGTEVDAIVDILVYTIQPGVVNLYVVEMGSGIARNPSLTKLSEVELSCRQSPDSTVYDRHPVQSTLNVLAPTFIDVSVAITGLDVSANNNSNRAAIKAALIEYLDALRPQIPALGYSAANATISEAEATSRCMVLLNSVQHPGTFEDLTISYLGTPLTNGRKMLGVGTLVNLSTLTINGSLVI